MHGTVVGRPWACPKYTWLLCVSEAEALRRVLPFEAARFSAHINNGMRGTVAGASFIKFANTATNGLD